MRGWYRVTWDTPAVCGASAREQEEGASAPLSCRLALSARACWRRSDAAAAMRERPLAGGVLVGNAPSALCNATLRPAPRLAAERVALSRRRAMPTDLNALLQRWECNRHTYSRLVPINASTTKAARDGECGRIWQPVQWVRHVHA